MKISEILMSTDNFNNASQFIKEGMDSRESNDGAPPAKLAQDNLDNSPSVPHNVKN
jgi:hypothetical protein